ncbi:MAG TPA: DUF4142 domain-containing protein [Pseudolabrys sp.]|nr:DUF4142 domain-containing protein [Pseudolabrys sp.]
MIRTPLLAIGFAAAIALAATGAEAQMSQPNTAASQMKAKPSKADSKFLTEAVQGDLAEVQAGKLAQQKGQADDVKKFGEMLVQDHSAHLKEAQDMAQQMDVTAPTEPSAGQKKGYDKLSKASDARFDREFKQAMIKDHKEAIAMYRKEAKGKGPLASFAQKTIPTLEKHLKTAEALGRAPATTGSR